jgi:hypothetical protein
MVKRSAGFSMTVVLAMHLIYAAQYGLVPA